VERKYKISSKSNQ